MGIQSPVVYQFGVFRLEPAERLLLRNGVAVPITPKAFDFLTYLVERHGRLCEKQAVLSAVWPDSVVEEANLPWNVSVLRRLLDDPSGGESMIQTVPTRGYRFVAAVTVSSPEAATSGSPAVSTASTPNLRVRTRSPRREAAIAATLVAGLIGLVAWSVAWHRPSPVAAEPSLTRLVAESGGTDYNGVAKISRDGRMLAYTDRAGVHLQFIDSGDTHLIPGTAGLYVYAWNRQSTAVRAAQCDHATMTCRGWDLAVIAGPPHLNGAQWSFHDGVVASADGERLLEVNDNRIFKVDFLNGTPPREVLRVADQVLTSSFNDDASRLLFVPAGHSAVDSVSIQGGQSVRVLQAETGQTIQEVLGLDGERLALVVRRYAPAATRARSEFSIQEVRLDASGIARGRPRLLVPWQEEPVGELSASADGSRLIFRSGVADTISFISDFDAATGLSGDLKRVSTDWGESVSTWTRDGSSVLINSTRNDEGDIFEQPIDGGPAQPIVTGVGRQMGAQATGDGHWLFYLDSGTGTGAYGEPTRIMRIPRAGGHAEVAATVNGFAVTHCSFRGPCVLVEIHDNDVIVFALDPVHGRGAELYRSQDGREGFCIMPDGNAVAMVRNSPHNDTIRIVSLVDRTTRDVVVRGIPFAYQLCPLADGSGVLTTTDDPTGHGMLAVVRLDGSSRVIWSDPQMQPYGALSSPDGRHLAVIAARSRNNLWLVSGL